MKTSLNKRGVFHYQPNPKLLPYPCHTCHILSNNDTMIIFQMQVLLLSFCNIFNLFGNPFVVFYIKSPKVIFCGTYSYSCGSDNIFF